MGTTKRLTAYECASIALCSNWGRFWSLRLGPSSVFCAPQQILMESRFSCEKSTGAQ